LHTINVFENTFTGFELKTSIYWSESNSSTRRKPSTYRKSRTNLITYYISMVSLYNMYSWFGRNIAYFWGRRSRDRGSWIYNYLCNQCLSPLTLRVRIPLWRGVLDTTLCDQVCPWLTVGRWFSPGTRIWFGPVNWSFQFKSCKCIEYTSPEWDSNTQCKWW
jgi:hypothetical protein